MPKQVVVVGAGIGGLGAAIHLKLAGYEVLVLDQRDQIGGKAAQIEQEGYRLDPGPSIVILTEIYEKLFAKAGRKMSDYLQFQRLDPFTRVYFEGQPNPIDLPANWEDCKQVLKDIAPQDAKAFDDLLAKLDQVAPEMDDSIFAYPIDQPWHLVKPPLARFARKMGVFTPYKQAVDAMFTSPILKAFFYGFPSYGGQSYNVPSPGSLLIPYYMIRRGVFWPIGGIGAIPKALHKLATELGVEFRLNTKVTGAIVTNKKVTGLKTESGEVVAADGVVSNCDRLTFQAMIGNPQDLKPSYSYFTLHMGIKRKIPQLSHHTLFIPTSFESGFEELYKDRIFPTRPIIYVNETSTIDPTTAPEGCTNFFAVVTCPSMEKHLDWPAMQDDLRIRLLNELRGYGLEFIEPEIAFSRVQTPATFAQRDGNYKGSLYGPDEKYRLWGFMPLRCRDEQISNLFYCGGSVQPGAGMPMVTLSGMFAADLVKAALR